MAKIEIESEINKIVMSVGHRALTSIASTNLLVSRALFDLRNDQTHEKIAETPSDPTILREVFYDGFGHSFHGRAGVSMKCFDSVIRAIQVNEKILNIEPVLIHAFSERAILSESMNELDNALMDYDAAIRFWPTTYVGVGGFGNISKVYFLRGQLWLRENEYYKAVADFDTSIRIKPDRSYYIERLSWLLATCSDDNIRDGKRAVELAGKACALTDWENPLVIDILAAAYAENGQYDMAVVYETKVLEDEFMHDFGDLDDIRKRLELYKQNKPYRE